MMLRVMVAVRRRWLQRKSGGGEDLAERCVGFTEEFVKAAGKAEEIEMNTVELQRILGYLNIGLAIAHDSGVSIGHFGSGDFIQLAQTVNGTLLHSIAPETSNGAEGMDKVESNAVPAGTAFVV